MPEPVVNASPLILLARAGESELLALLGTPVLVPRQVADEIEQRDPTDPTVRVLRETPWLEAARTLRPCAAGHRRASTRRDVPL